MVDLTSIPQVYHADYTALYDDLTKTPLKIHLPNQRGTVIPFFTFYVKKQWSPTLARLEFYNNWFSFLITLVSFGLSNIVLAIIGASSLMVGQLVVHFWYGYIKHPNPATACIAQSNERFEETFNERDEDFDAAVDKMSVLYHGRPVNGDQTGVKIVGIFIRGVNDLVALVCIVAISLAILGTYCFSSVYVASGSERQLTQDEIPWFLLAACLVASLSGCLVEVTFSSAGALAAIAGSFAWVVLYIMADFENESGGYGLNRSTLLALRLVATIMLFLLEEYYTTLLFQKSLKEFLKSAVLQVVSDVFSFDGGVDEIPSVPSVDSKVTNSANVTKCRNHRDPEATESTNYPIDF